MAKSYNQKMKILFLLQLFQKEQGEEKIYSMQRLVELLAEQGIRAERKSIYDDLEVLRQYGLDIRFRKERPSGYYLVKPEEELTDDTANREKESPAEEALFREEGERKSVKLLCDGKGKELAMRYLGDHAVCKEKGEGRYLVSGDIVAGPGFYGWLTAAGRGVHIQKPKKEAAAYRDYLKAIAKDYKGI